MLRASIIGNLGSDPEIRYSAEGQQIATVRVAVNQRKKNPDDNQWTEGTNWFRIRCTGWRAELAQKLAKGQRVYVCGRLEINEYQRRDGTPGISYDIWADELHGMSGRDGSANGAEPARASAPESTAPAAVATPADLEDLPF